MTISRHSASYLLKQCFVLNSITDSNATNSGLCRIHPKAHCSEYKYLKYLNSSSDGRAVPGLVQIKADVDEEHLKISNKSFGLLSKNSRISSVNWSTSCTPTSPNLSSLMPKDRSAPFSCPLPPAVCLYVKSSDEGSPQTNSADNKGPTSAQLSFILLKLRDEVRNVISCKHFNKYFILNAN